MYLAQFWIQLILQLVRHVWPIWREKGLIGALGFLFCQVISGGSYERAGNFIFNVSGKTVHCRLVFQQYKLVGRLYIADLCYSNTSKPKRHLNVWYSWMKTVRTQSKNWRTWRYSNLWIWVLERIRHLQPYISTAQCRYNTVTLDGDRGIDNVIILKWVVGVI